MNDITPLAAYACADNNFSDETGTVRLPFGEDESGAILHISQVTSGLACKCKCPSCGTALVARRGPLVEHHFAHHAVKNCCSAAETALHKFAKQVLEQKRWLQLPAVEATERGECLVIHPSRKFHLDAVELEKRLTGIVPDVIARKGERELLIEIYVTHPCDARKRQKIREIGIAAVEIDLSGLTRDATLEAVEEAILRTAPRQWLFNEKRDAAAQDLRTHEEQRKTRERAAAERKVVELAKAVEQAKAGKFRRRVSAATECAARVRAEGYDHAIGLGSIGDVCFVVPPDEWQAFVFDDVVLGALRTGAAHRFNIGEKVVLARVRAAGLIAPPFCGFVEEETLEGMTGLGISLELPFVCIRRYMDSLSQRNVLHKLVRNWNISTTIIRDWEDRERKDRERSNRFKGIQDLVWKSLADVPEDEKSDFSIETWFRRIQLKFGVSFHEAITQDLSPFFSMKSQLDRVHSMVCRQGPVVDDLLGLPLKKERERQQAAREEEVSKKRKATEEAEREAAQKRREALTNEARFLLGADAQSWLSGTCPQLGDRPPGEMALDSTAGLATAQHALRAEAAKRESASAAARKIEEHRAKLTAAARGALPPAHAELFLRSAHPGLGNQRPIEYCTDERSYAACVRLLQPAKSGKR